MAKWTFWFHRARSRYEAIQTPIEQDNRYRHYPLYGALIVAFHLMLYCWPIDFDILVLTWREHRWLLVLRHALEMASFGIAVCLGAIGIFRKPLFSKLLSVFAILGGLEMITQGGLSALPGKMVTVLLWYVFDLPEKLIVHVSDGNAALETMYWSIYLMIAWLLLRPLFKRSWRAVLWAEQRVLSRWPGLRHLNEPLI